MSRQKSTGQMEFRHFFKITLPMLSPIVKNYFNAGDRPGHLRIMSQSWYLQTADRTTVHRSCFYYIYQLIFGKDVGTNPQIGYATVLSLVAALIIGIVTAVYMYFCKKT